MGERLEFADALRGYAILGVMLVHCWIALNPINLPEWLKTASINGSFGVQLFFIASAFTLFYSLTYAHVKLEGWKSFFIRRIFRVVPMFYIAIVLYSVILFANWFPVIGTTPADAGIPNILTHLTFLFGFDPVHINTLVPGGWSIATELAFYLTIPIIYTYVKNTTHVCILLLGSALANIIFSISKNSFAIANPTYTFYWLPNQFPVFCLGILLFFLLKEVTFNSELIKRCIGFGSISVSLGLLYYFIFIYASPMTGTIKLYALSIAFMIFAFGLAVYPGVMVNKFITHLGKISYSCYLLHFIVVSAISSLIIPLIPEITIPVFIGTYLSVILITMGISSLTYTYIEAPGINIGKQLEREL